MKFTRKFREDVVMDILKVSANSRPTSVAGAIAGVIREKGSVEVQAVGAGAANQAIKSVAVARGYMCLDITSMRVDFPAPFGPTMAMCSPFERERETSLSMSFPSRLTFACSILTISGIRNPAFQSWFSCLM